MQALMLAAGAGVRMKGPLNKGLITIAGKSLFERFVGSLGHAAITRLTVVTGHNADGLERAVLNVAGDLEVTFVRNEDYAVTNNIWSLYLARDRFAEDDTILLESDLIYDEGLLKKLVEFPFPNVAVVAELESRMNGTTVLLEGNKISKFVLQNEFEQKNFGVSYKTVNIYKLSREYIRNAYIPALESCINDFGRNRFYEAVFKGIPDSPHTEVRAFVLEGEWYEIDTEADLNVARAIFEKPGGGNQRKGES